jgi:cysteine desulfurase/selenocysteine lyase
MEMNYLPRSLRSDYPALGYDTPSGHPLIYLDSAATALRPRAVIESVQQLMAHGVGSIHRSVHFLGDIATEQYERARRMTARWLGAVEHQIVFTRNTTDSIQMIAEGWPDRRAVLASASDHHSTILPWGADRTRLLPILEDGSVDESALLRELESGEIAVVCLAHLSNVTGAMIDSKRIAKLCHQYGAIFVLDAAQSAAHESLDVDSLECDFLAFSGHKLGSPGGIGVLWGRNELLERLESVQFPKIQYRPVPWRFESGTPAIESVVGLSAAIGFLLRLDPEEVVLHLQSLRRHAIQQLLAIPRLKILGSTDKKSCGPISFVIPGHSSHVLARSLSDAFGICIRSGYHCAEPLHLQWACGPSMRMSFHVYNQPEEIDRCCEGLQKLADVSHP